MAEIIKNKKRELSTKIYSIDKPQQMARMAAILKIHIAKNELYMITKDKKTGKEKAYVYVEGWQFAGGMLGLKPIITKVEELSENKWRAEAEIINRRNGEIEGRGIAICSKKEAKKTMFEEYAIVSMAQTRAIGKAYRNILGWVMKMAGYEGTPAEEMKGEPIEMNNIEDETKVPPKANLTPLERTIADIRENKNKKTLLNWLVQVDTSKAWTESQKRVLRENINLQIKTL